MHEIALTFVIAPLPNALFSHCGGEDFSTDYGEGSGPIDLGRFITAFIVVTGFSLPLVLAHSEIIKPGASIMSLIGGGYVRVAIRLPPSFRLTTSAFTSLAALYMGLSWHTQPPSDKMILITSSPSTVPFQGDLPVLTSVLISLHRFICFEIPPNTEPFFATPTPCARAY